MKEKELEQQKNQLEQQNKLKRQRIISLSALLGFILMLSLAFVVYRSYRHKKIANKLLKDKNDKILVLNQKISVQKKHITDSIQYAKRIQEAVFPPTNLIENVFKQHFIFFRPRDIVSGDFYWAYKNKNLSIIAAADCTGHGVPVAFMSMLGIAFLNEIMSKLNNENITADKILNELRNYVKISLRQTGKMNEAKDGMDIALCVFDFEQNKLQFAAAHNPLLLIRNKELIQYKADRMPIGIHIKEKPFKNNIIETQKGDQFYIYSDGYIDQFGGSDGKKFKTKQLKNLLIENSHKSLSEQRAIIQITMDNWQKPASGKTFEQIDDIILIAIKI